MYFFQNIFVYLVLETASNWNLFNIIYNLKSTKTSGDKQ